VDGAPPVRVHLAAVRSVKVEHGILWSDCTFEISRRGAKQQVDVGGIANATADGMKAAIDLAVKQSLGSIILVHAKALMDWRARAHQKLAFYPGTYVDSAQIDFALAAARTPSDPIEATWQEIFTHPLIPQVKAAYRGEWPAPETSMRDELFGAALRHNNAVFTENLTKWVLEFSAAHDWQKWTRSSDITRFLASNPAPNHPAARWEDLPEIGTPREILSASAALSNELHIVEQWKKLQGFFSTVEKNPLTEEQIEACICMEDNVLIVAAAGSGKTSTMVAKTGYILHEGLASPEQILLLAFNKEPAQELANRIKERLGTVPGVEQIKAQTFHGFGLEVIGKATGKKPSIAPWVTDGKDGEFILEILNSLATSNASLGRAWALFRTVFARDTGKWDEPGIPEAYEGGKRGFRTARGEIVKSKQERVLADWLFFHGVNYVYEKKYEVDTADADHRQYFPDFYYPDIDVYHEHFALDAQGRPPDKFEGYLEGVIWKRELHAERETKLFETTSHELQTGRAFVRLEEMLTRAGLTLSFDASRAVPGEPPVRELQLARSFRVFQQHAKNNGLSPQDLEKAMEQQAQGGNGARLALFLHLYRAVADEWARRLQAENYIDFEDMLLQAADHVESGRYQSPFTVVLADEFQDSSRARIRLLKALTQCTNEQVHLCVVGDDWQGINRFAGSDIAVVREFEGLFGEAKTLTLNTTFRCPNELCSASSEFVMANPAQIEKSVATTNPITKPSLLAFGFKQRESIPEHVGQTLQEMYAAATAGKIRPAKGEHVTAILLGRYRDDKPGEIALWQKKFASHLQISFMTVHASKGLEAEYVFLLNAISGVRGFPSQIEDDPALQMAMPSPDPFPYAEERRLFYVALTRARKQIRIYTLIEQPSEFLVEMVGSGALSIKGVEGEPLSPCPECGTGFLVARASKHGGFRGCSRFPRCAYVEREERPQRAQKRRGSSRGKRREGPCSRCGSGRLELKTGSWGSFLGCSNYPACTAKFDVD
jgi:DNA helicase IV